MIENNLMLVPLSHYRKWLIPILERKAHEFIRKSKLIYGDKYDYSELQYVNCKIKVKLICKEHGEFWVVPDRHINNNQGCPICTKEKITKDRMWDNDTFIKNAKSVHGDVYDYSQSEYKGYHTPVKILCRKHGEFFKCPSDHISKKEGCPICSKENVAEKRKFTADLTKSIINDKFKGRFKLIDSSYNGFSKEASFIDTEKGNIIITISPINLIKRKLIHDEKSNGEYIIRCWLIENNISFKDEIYISELIRIKRGVKIDFVIKINNHVIWIEYNGIQHYVYDEFLHKWNIENFKDQLRRDENVRKYCKENSIKLIEVPYIYGTRESIFDFLNKTIINNVDPHTLVDYESLFKRPLDYKPYSENEDN
jgi:hypothetical protein